jgi:hypothetical protein
LLDLSGNDTSNTCGRVGYVVLAPMVDGDPATANL